MKTKTTSKVKTKCSCALAKKITCPNCSELKMAIMLKNGNNELKSFSKAGKLVNPVWYNHLSKNHKKTEILINAMYRRFQSSIYAGVTNKIMFFDNSTKQLLTTITL